MSIDANSRSVGGLASQDFDEDRSDATQAAAIQPDKAQQVRPIDPVETQNAEIKVEHPSGGRPSPEAAQTLLSRLGEAVISGLVHCACTHEVVHPELLDLATGQTTVPPPSSRVTNDAS